MDSACKSFQGNLRMSQNDPNNTPQGRQHSKERRTAAKARHCRPAPPPCPEESLTKTISSNSRLSSPYFLDSKLLSTCKFLPSTRSKMVLWFIEECHSQMTTRVVCSKAIALLDWFLMKGGKIGTDKIQQLGIACLGIAMKLNNCCAGIVSVDEKSFSKANIIVFQTMVLQMLNYRVEGLTYSSAMLQLLYQWDNFVYDMERENDLPLYLDRIQDDECKDFGAVLRLDEILSVIDLCSSVLGFLDFSPEDVAFNVLAFFVKMYKSWPQLTSPNCGLAETFSLFLEEMPRDGHNPMGKMGVSEKLQKNIEHIYSTLSRERQIQVEKTGYDQVSYLTEATNEFFIKDAVSMSREDNYERRSQRRCMKTVSRQMNLLETVLNVQIFKPYYGRVSRSLLKNLQPLLE